MSLRNDIMIECLVYLLKHECNPASYSDVIGYMEGRRLSLPMNVAGIVSRAVQELEMCVSPIIPSQEMLKRALRVMGLEHKLDNVNPPKDEDDIGILDYYTRVENSGGAMLSCMYAISHEKHLVDVFTLNPERIDEHKYIDSVARHIFLQVVTIDNVTTMFDYIKHRCTDVFTKYFDGHVSEALNIFNVATLPEDKKYLAVHCAKIVSRCYFWDIDTRINAYIYVYLLQLQSKNYRVMVCDKRFLNMKLEDIIEVLSDYEMYWKEVPQAE